MNQRLYISFIALFLVLNFVSAVDTKITVETLPAHEVTLSIVNPSSEEIVSILKRVSDEYGDAQFTYTGSQSPFQIMVVVKEDGELVLHSKSLDDPFFNKKFTVGSIINVTVLPDGVEPIARPVKNDTPVVVTNISATAPVTNTSVASTENTSSPLTGFFVSGYSFVAETLAPPTGYYVGGGILGVIVLFFLVRTIRRRKHSSSIHPTHTVHKHTRVETPLVTVREPVVSASSPSVSPSPQNRAQRILDAERKLREAQREIERVKKEERLEQIRKRIDEQ